MQRQATLAHAALAGIAALTLADLNRALAQGASHAPDSAATTGPGLVFGDANADRIVNFLDLNICLSQFGQVGALSADFNHDGRVDFLDLNILLSTYGQINWGVGAALPAPAGDVVVRPGANGNFTFSVINLMPTLAQTANYTITKSSGPSALFITPSNGTRPLTAGQTYSAGGQVFLQTPTDAGTFSEIKLQVAGQGGAAAEAVKKVCVVPTGETNAWNAWDAANATVGRWRGTLTPANVNFNGRSVTERDPGGGGPDSCHFNGATYAAFTAITGGTWAVGAGNVWGDDFVGWFPAAVTYYRNQGRAPCGTTFPQRMEINCPNGDQAYQTNTLGCAMTAAIPAMNGNPAVPGTVSSTRSGNTQTKNWP